MRHRVAPSLGSGWSPLQDICLYFAASNVRTCARPLSAGILWGGSGSGDLGSSQVSANAFKNFAEFAAIALICCSSLVRQQPIRLKEHRWSCSHIAGIFVWLRGLLRHENGNEGHGFCCSLCVDRVTCVCQRLYPSKKVIGIQPCGGRALSSTWSLWQSELMTCTANSEKYRWLAIRLGDGWHGFAWVTKNTMSKAMPVVPNGRRLNRNASILGGSRCIPGLLTAVYLQEKVTGPVDVSLPEAAAGSSLQFANHFYPTAASLGNVNVVCVVGKLTTGRPLTLSERWQYYSQLKRVPKEVARKDFAFASYKANCGDGHATGDGVCDINTALLPSARHVILDSVYHSPGSGLSWYGSREVIPQWSTYIGKR